MSLDVELYAYSSRWYNRDCPFSDASTVKMSRSLSVTVKVSPGTAPAPVQTRMEQVQTTPEGRCDVCSSFLKLTEWNSKTRLYKESLTMKITNANRLINHPTAFGFSAGVFIAKALYEWSKDGRTQRHHSNCSDTPSKLRAHFPAFKRYWLKDID